MRSETEIREMFIEQLKEYNEQLKARIKPFEDGYFNGLSPIEIAELAKKSIRLTCENRRLEDLQQEIKAIAEKLMADNLCNNCDGIGLDANCQDTGCPYYQMDKILQKITKAEEE